jgi:SAM-dependent methyltransferase
MPTMPFADAALAAMARLFSRGELAHTGDMKAAIQTEDAFRAYRTKEAERVIAALHRFGLDLTGKRVLDLGCDTGSLSVEFANRGAASVVAVDISADAIEEARRRHADSNVAFAVSELAALPIPDASVDLILSYDVFEHVSNPLALLRECRRVLAPGGDMLIGTWGWGHPFAHHFFAEMPVPWAHLFVSDATLQRACRRVCASPWYVPTWQGTREAKTMDLDAPLDGEFPSRDYLNRYYVNDFERSFEESGLRWRVDLLPFGRLPWVAPLLRVPGVREYFHAYVWAHLQSKP